MRDGAGLLAELGALLASMEGLFDGEEVDEATHAWQCAGLAQSRGFDDEMIAAALVHDIARAPALRGPAPHELIGAEWARERFGPRVAFLVEAHVAAKLFLMEQDPGYASGLSAESLRTAALQRSSGYAAYERNIWWPDAIELRRIDDLAKDPRRARPDEATVYRAVRSAAELAP